MNNYRPPFARMRDIKRDNPPKKFREALPENVEEAIEEMAARQEEGQQVEDEIRVPVDEVEVVVKPGKDKKFGTDDDEVTVEPKKASFKPPEPAPEPAPENEPARPEYDMTWRKPDLIALADSVGVPSDGTKSEIIEALDEHFDD